MRGAKLHGYLIVKLLYLNPVFELYSFYHFPKLPESSQPAPVVLRTQTQLEHHAQHPLSAQTPFRVPRAMTDGRKRRFNWVGGAQAVPVHRWEIVKRQ